MNKNIPDKTVTFLFTDIEGSTRLAQEFPDTLQKELEIHNSILSKAVKANHGFVFEIIGDAFCCAFGNAINAVECACEIQLKLSSQKVNRLNIKVRIGINTGDAEWNGKRYSGYVTLARTQRVMSAGHGGQVLMTQNTYELVKDQLNSVNDIRYLGEKQLKDLMRTDKIYQLIIPGTSADFPPLKTEDVRKNNLPVQLTKFIGREKEFSSVKELLSKNNLITLTGPGGTGKTRLVLEAASQLTNDFTDGIWLVELASLSDPCHIYGAIASALNLTESGNRRLKDVIKNYLNDKEALLIIDNCEHLIHNCAKISEDLLTSCPKLKIIATSREALKISGEIVYQVPVLSLPDLNKNFSINSLLEFESVRLFLNRAKNVKPEFELTNDNAPAIARLCYNLDGIPLAIELAAARIRVLSPIEILENLKTGFDLLIHGSRNVSPRQQTLRSLIDWSYGLLCEKEKLLFARLAVFKGGFTLERVKEICTDKLIGKDEVLDLITNLSDKSLLTVNESGNCIRYNMLETINNYAIGKLTDENKIYLKHFKSFLKLSKESEKKLKGPEQFAWLRIVEAELGNIRAAIKWSLRTQPGKSLELVKTISFFWSVKSFINEGIEFSHKILNRTKHIDTLDKATLLRSLGDFMITKGKFDNAEEYYTEALQLAERLKSKEDILHAKIKLGQILFYREEIELAHKKLKVYVVQARKVKNKLILAETLRTFAVLLIYLEEFDKARKYFTECLNLFKKMNNVRQIAISKFWLGRIALIVKDPVTARRTFEEIIPVFKKLGDRIYQATVIHNLAELDFEDGLLDSALELNDEAYSIFNNSGMILPLPIPLFYSARIYFLKGDYLNSRKMFQEIIKLRKEIKITNVLNDCICGIAAINLKNGKLKKAVTLFSFYVYFRKKNNFQSLRPDLDFLGNNLETLKSELSDQDFKSSVKEGRSMKLETALEFAMNDDM